MHTALTLSIKRSVALCLGCFTATWGGTDLFSETCLFVTGLQRQDVGAIEFNEEENSALSPSWHLLFFIRVGYLNKRLWIGSLSLSLSLHVSFFLCTTSACLDWCQMSTIRPSFSVPQSRKAMSQISNELKRKCLTGKTRRCHGALLYFCLFMYREPVKQQCGGTGGRLPYGCF